MIYRFVVGSRKIFMKYLCMQRFRANILDTVFAWHLTNELHSQRNKQEKNCTIYYELGFFPLEKQFMWHFSIQEVLHDVLILMTKKICT